MDTKIQKYSEKSVGAFGRSVSTLASSANQVSTEIQLAYDAANMRGRFRQLEADIILEYEFGLPPRRKKKNQSW